jgi:hypothetical protein
MPYQCEVHLRLSQLENEAQLKAFQKALAQLVKKHNKEPYGVAIKYDIRYTTEEQV